MKIILFGSIVFSSLHTLFSDCMFDFVIGRKVWSADLPQSVPRLAQAWGLHCKHKDGETCQGSKDSQNAL